MSFTISRIVVVAGRYQDAALFCQQLGLPKNLWSWIDYPERLHGVTNFLVFELETFPEHPHYERMRWILEDYIKLRRCQVCKVSLDGLLGIQRHGRQIDQPSSPPR